MNDGSSFPGSRNGWSRWALHSNAPVLVLFKTATCIISSHWFQMRLNEMHLGLRQLAVVHSTLLSNIPVKQQRLKADTNVPVADWRLLEIPRLDYSSLLPPPAAAAYSRLFSRRRWSRPGLITDKREGGHATGKKNGDSTQKSSWHWWAEVDFAGWNQPIKVWFLVSPP